MIWHIITMMTRSIRAFALLEVAIALSVLGVIAYMGVPLISRIQNWQQTRSTATHQEQIMEALGAYVLANSRLPCPAEDKNGKSQPGKSVGFVPYQTLGIPEKAAKDGQHHWMTYVVQPSLTSKSILFLQDPGISTDPKTIFCKTSATEKFTVNRNNGESCITEPDFAAVAIISHGNSGGYYLDNGTVQPVNSDDPHKKENAARANIFTTKNLQRIGSNIFDDIIIFASRNNLMANWAKCPCKTTD